MEKFTNPLDKIKIASPCEANWDEMNGDERRRFCSLCQLNVYNLSEMTRDEAERFLFNSEDNICTKFYRRTDGSILTRDCLVGRKKVKRRISQIVTATLSMIAGFFGGMISLYPFANIGQSLVEQVKVENNDDSRQGERLLIEAEKLTYQKPIIVVGRPNLDDIRGKPKR